MRLRATAIALDTLRRVLLGLDIPPGWGPEDERAPGGRRRWIPVVAIVVAIAMLIWALRLF